MVFSDMQVKKAYFVGIKGVAMTSLALFMKGNGVEVAGSDVEERFPTDISLQKAGISYFRSFHGDNLSSFHPDIVIYTGAHGGRNNPEVQAAISGSIPVFPQGQALGIVMGRYKQISVCGSHGKTTTSAMIATLLSDSDIDCSYAVGCGSICPLGYAGHAGKGTWFVAEADEYVTDPGTDLTPRFMWQHPDITVLTNIDYDHPDVYKSMNDVIHAFAVFLGSMSKDGVAVLPGDDGNAVRLLTDARVLYVGMNSNADYRIRGFDSSHGKTIITVGNKTGTEDSLTINVPGKHNAVNAVMAGAAAFEAGLSWDRIKTRLTLYCGSARRFELLGKSGHMLFYDDYAHHPREIKTTLQSARSWFPDKTIVCVFQPHTYTRTQALLSDFSTAFGDCDTVILTDIYASARETIHETTLSDQLVQKTKEHHGSVIYCHTFEEVRQSLQPFADRETVVIFMGAGDIYQYGRDIATTFMANR